MTKTIVNNIDKSQSSQSVSSLAQAWAKKYMQSLSVETEHGNSDLFDKDSTLSQEGRQKTAEKLQKALRFTSSQAWAKTEALLAQQVQNHNLDPDLIDPWQISVDCHALFDKTLEIYAQRSASQTSISEKNSSQSSTDLISPAKLATKISKDIGRVRYKYTAKDPRVLGFVSMQFHYSGQMLLDLLNPIEKTAVGSYLKVIDDHLYMPLERAYDAAADLTYNSPELLAVRDLMPITSEISKTVCEKVISLYPYYNCYSGQLQSQAIKSSSLRDVEMFQIYLCLCVLEGNISSIQEELFPICVMLYPPLKVSWDLIRNMLRLLGQELSYRLNPSDVDLFSPYINAMSQMFSEEILMDRPTLVAA